MDEIQHFGFANLANLETDLKEAEEAGDIKCDNQDLQHAREALLGVIQTFACRAYELGSALRVYRSYFKAEHGWVKAASVIAGAIGRSPRTIYRLVEEYEYASQLPQITRDAMQEQQIEPCARKNAGLVTALLKEPQPSTREDADAAVKIAYQNNLAQKQQRKMTVETEEVSIDKLAARISKILIGRYKLADPSKRDDELQNLFELVASKLQADITPAGHVKRPIQVIMPTIESAA